MYLKKVSIKNFKAIAEMELELQKGVNLLIGDNGAGKTSVLDAVAVGLGGYLSELQAFLLRIYHLTRFGFSLSKWDRLLRQLSIRFQQKLAAFWRWEKRNMNGSGGERMSIQIPKRLSATEVSAIMHKI